MTAMTPFPVAMTIRQWQVVDSVVDNEVNTRAEEGDDHFVDVGMSVREAGWDQLTGESRTWPAGDQGVTVALNLEQWGLVVSSLAVQMTIEVDEPVGDPADSLQTIRDLITAQVANPLPEFPLPED